MKNLPDPGPTMQARIKALEQELAEARAHNARLERLIAQAGVGIATVELDGQLTEVNPALERMLGYARAELVGQTFEVVTFPEDTARQRSAMADLLAGTGDAFDIEKRYVAKDGRLLWGHVYFSLVRDAQGRPDFLLGVVLNTDRQKRAEQEREREMALLDRIFKNAPAGFVFVDRLQRIMMVNPIMERLLGRSADSLLGRTPGEFSPVAQGNQDDFERQLAKVLEQGQVFHVMGLPVRLDINGEPRLEYRDLAVVPVYGDDDVLTGSLAMVIDVSARVDKERLQAELIESLRALDRAKDDFLAVLGHELRTPLNGVYGFISILQDGLAGGLTAGQQDLLAKVAASADRMLAVVNDLLDMSRIQTGKLVLDLRTVDFAEIARAVVAGQQVAAGRLRLTSDVPDDLPVVVADEQRVAQILTNLIGNAIKFTRPGGSVHLWAKVAGDALRVEVRDEGTGIAPEAIPTLFHPFSQVDGSATRTAGGLGLGLAIVKSLVQAHGGQVGVESEPGRGSTFWFELPLAGPPHQTITVP
ncbi:MAG: sensor signal transduction histidine kinase [Cyanobacteria bacterium RYN_339]|nr:sensor signal transduction histidine kinase [Cyanobacteria bacterium RYN_339]